MAVYTYSGNDFTVEIAKDAITVTMRGYRCAVLRPDAAVEKFGVDEKDETRSVELKKLAPDKYEYDIEGSLWNKRIALDLEPRGFNFKVTLVGKGKIGKVSYFASYENGGVHGSDFDFHEYYVPFDCTDPMFNRVNNSLRSYRSTSELLVPPPYFFSFSTPDVEKVFSLALLAKPGENNFIHYDYELPRGFTVTTTLEGLTEVDGEFEIPFIRFYTSDTYDSAATEYSAYNFEAKLCPENKRENTPRWWRGPFVCSWGEQGFYGAEHNIGFLQASCQNMFEWIVEQIDMRGLKPSVLIIDDKWQQEYGSCLPNKDQWPDMRGFIDKMHARGIRVLLWYRFWCPDGLDEDMLITADKTPYRFDFQRDLRYADPTNPKYREYMKKTIRTLLSNEEGCYNADGFKLDYAFLMPYGPKAKTYGNQYGAELLKTYIKMFYDFAKAVKPDALINCSPCHPYFNDVCDQARLHDPAGFRNHRDIMAYRSRLYRAMLPGVLVDADTADYSTHDTAMRYYRAQPTIGAPDIYRFSNSESCTFTDEDWAEIRAIYNGYAEEMDRLYGKDEIK